MIYRLIAFLLLNFGALAIGGFFTGKGVTSDWYADLLKAPWTPPGWVCMDHHYDLFQHLPRIFVA